MEKELLRDLNELVERAQRILREYLPDDSGKSAERTISELLGVLDGPEQREVQGKVRRALERPALFEIDGR